MYPNVGAPVHVPGDAVSVPPTAAVPEIVGALVFCGVTLSAITGLGFVFALPAPSAFRAVTIASTVRPTSAARRR